MKICKLINEDIYNMYLWQYSVVFLAILHLRSHEYYHLATFLDNFSISTINSSYLLEYAELNHILVGTIDLNIYINYTSLVSYQY